MTTAMTTALLSFKPQRETLAASALIVAFVVLFVTFAGLAPSFLTTGNLRNILLNNVVMLGIVALGMTLVVASGGIDLAAGIAVDAGSLGFALALSLGVAAPLALGLGLAAALGVGLINALLIAGLRLNPFLATLALWFIGQSAQRLLTHGGSPIYLGAKAYAQTFSALTRSTILGVPTPIWLLILLVAGIGVLFHRGRLGREISAIGAAPEVAHHSGVRVGFVLGRVYLLSALLAGITGILLTATVRSYIPISGNGFLLDAIGATFIGTTLRRDGRPSVPGTIIGVALLGMVKNGLLLIGWNFYWQQVGIGVLVFAVLAVSSGLRRAKAA